MESTTILLCTLLMARDSYSYVFTADEDHYKKIRNIIFPYSHIPTDSTEIVVREEK